MRKLCTTARNTEPRAGIRVTAALGQRHLVVRTWEPRLARPLAARGPRCGLAACSPLLCLQGHICPSQRGFSERAEDVEADTALCRGPEHEVGRGAGLQARLRQHQREAGHLGERSSTAGVPGQYGIVCVEGLIREIYAAGKHFKEADYLLWAEVLFSTR